MADIGKMDVHDVSSLHRGLVGVFLGMLLISLGLRPTGADENLALSLRQAQQRAIEGNALLRAAAQEVEQARAGVLQSWSAFLPSVRLSEQAVRSNDAVNVFGFRLKQERFDQADFAIDRLNFPDALSDFQTTIEVQQPLFSGGRARHGRRQAVAAQHAAEANFAYRGAALRQQTAAAYWNLVLAQAVLTTVKQSAVAAHADAAVVDARYREGTALGTERLAAQLRVLDAQVEQAAAIDALAAAGDALSLLLGLPVTVHIEPTQDLQMPVEVATLAELQQMAQTLRADVRAAAFATQAAARGIGVARAAYWPQLSAFARADLDADAPLERQGESWTVGAAMVWQLPAPAAMGQVQKAKAQHLQARAQWTFLEAQVERQVRRAYRSVQTVRQQVVAREHAVELAIERRRIAGLQYREQMATATELLDARTVLDEVRLGHVRALRDLRVGLAQLELVVGSELENLKGEQN